MSIKQLIKPSNIRIDDHYWSTFGHSETEVSARWIIMFLRAREFVTSQETTGTQFWEPFTLSDLESFYQYLRGKPETFHFNRLTPRFISIYDNGILTVTDAFVAAIASNEKLISSEQLNCETKYVTAYIFTCRWKV
jgi:hypothetical protein